MITNLQSGNSKRLGKAEGSGIGECMVSLGGVNRIDFTGIPGVSEDEFQGSRYRGRWV